MVKIRNQIGGPTKIIARKKKQKGTDITWEYVLENFPLDNIEECLKILKTAAKDAQSYELYHIDLLDIKIFSDLLDDFNSLSLIFILTILYNLQFTIYMKYYEMAGKLTTKEESHEDNILILTSILKLREGIISMVALITAKLVGKLENEITVLKKNQKPVNNTKKKSKKKLKKI